MKKIVFILMIILPCFSFCFAETVTIKNKSIPKENQITLPSSPTGWTPNENDTEKALLSIVKYFKNSLTSSTDYFMESQRKILDEFSNYCVQFQGKIENGQKIITCDFFYKTKCEMFFPS